MSTYVNLMSNSARVRQCYRDRFRLWSRLLVSTLAMLSIHFLVNWWPLHAQNLNLQVLESHYVPLKEQKTDISRLTRKIANVRNDSQLELAISHDTPVLSLLGLVGEAVSNSQGKVFLENIDYVQAGAYGKRSSETEKLALSGLATDPWAVETLAEQLRAVVPLAEIQILKSEPIEINRHPMQLFQIECKL